MKKNNNQKMSDSHFKYHVSAPSNINFGYITLGGNKIHHIDNLHEFYAALGYTDEMHNEGIEAEEFVWFEYRRKGSTEFQICLQVKIIEFLIGKSITFKEKYSELIKFWLGCCNQMKASEIGICDDCKARPFLEL